MVQDLEIKSLSQIPAIELIDFEDPDNFKVTLPVCCLSLFKNSSWKPNAPAFLVFTDFSAVKDSAINHGDMVSPSVPRDYFFNDSAQPFDKCRLLTTSVPGFKFASVCTELRKADTSFAREVSFQDKYNCQFENWGIFAKLTIYLKVYKGKLESNFGSLTLIDNTNWQTLFPEKDPRLRDAFINVLVNFKRISSPMIFQRACRRLDIESIIEPEPSLEPPAKIPKRATGIGLIYQQFCSTDDTQAPISLNSQLTDGGNSLSTSQYETGSQRLSQGNSPDYSSQSSEKNRNRLALEQATVEQYLVTRVTIQQILERRATLEDIRRAQIYEVDVYIKGMIPLESIFVKPYNRTLKIAPFKFILTDASSTKHLTVEFINTAEICKFLHLNEVEDAFERLDELQKAIRAVLNHSDVLHSKLKLQQRVDDVTPSIYRPYWTSLSTLDSLVSALP